MLRAVLHNEFQNHPHFDPDAPKAHNESFEIMASSPDGQTAFWTRISLVSKDGDTKIQTLATLYEKETDKIWAAQEEYGVKDLAIDLEREGMGAGHTYLQAGASHGEVHAENHHITWKFSINAALPPYLPLPKERFYRSSLLDAKIATPYPAATLSGRLELWQKGYKNGKIFNLEGWNAVQHHYWGKRMVENFALIHTSTIEGQSESFFEFIAASPKLAGFFSRKVNIGRLVLDGKIYRFDTCPHFRAVGAFDYKPSGWVFALTGPDGDLKGSIEKNETFARALPIKSADGKIINLLTSPLAKVEMFLTPKGEEERKLTSYTATYQMGTTALTHGIPALIEN